MYITKCDICTKQIKNWNEKVRVEHKEAIDSLDFCLACAAPVTAFLKKHQLLKKAEKVMTTAQLLKQISDREKSLEKKAKAVKATQAKK